MAWRIGTGTNVLLFFTPERPQFGKYRGVRRMNAYRENKSVHQKCLEVALKHLWIDKSN
jgi:hypothetical protein